MQRRVLESVSAIALALLLAAGCGQARPGRPLAAQPLSGLSRPTSSHVIVLVMENAEDTDVLGNPAAPYTAALVRRYGLATQSFAITHPSLPNYLALTSGSTDGVSSDCTDCHVGAANIVDQLEAAGISWRAYLEDQPTACFRGATAGGYAKKHNPFIYYDDIARSRHRCGRLVGFAQLAADLRRGRLPTYAWISPNLCDDGHDCGVAGATGSSPAASRRCCTSSDHTASSCSRGTRVAPTGDVVVERRTAATSSRSWSAPTCAAAHATLGASTTMELSPRSRKLSACHCLPAPPIQAAAA